MAPIRQVSQLPSRFGCSNASDSIWTHYGSIYTRGQALRQVIVRGWASRSACRENGPTQSENVQQATREGVGGLYMNAHRLHRPVFHLPLDSGKDVCMFIVCSLVPERRLGKC